MSTFYKQFLFEKKTCEKKLWRISEVASSFSSEWETEKIITKSPSPRSAEKSAGRFVHRRLRVISSRSFPMLRRLRSCRRRFHTRRNRLRTGRRQRFRTRRRRRHRTSRSRTRRHLRPGSQRRRLRRPRR